MMPCQNTDEPVTSVVIGVCIVDPAIERVAEIGEDGAAIAMVMMFVTVAMMMVMALSAVSMAVSAMTARKNRAGAKMRCAECGMSDGHRRATLDASESRSMQVNLHHAG
ncbi:hypothetical protein DFP91_0317 [Pseudorhodoplanes sinuspersici]|nr:hypothetical protein DFP91_0317 [Pseudorhodoplanes sinuspersici]